MKKFDWKKFRNEKIAVHCKTEEEAKDFCKKMHEQGMKWNGDGNSFLGETKYRTFQEKTCYSGTGCYCPYDYYKENKYTILEWSDYMRKEFTKSDLKDGMVIEERTGERWAVYGNKMLTNFDWNSLDEYSDDLREIKYKKTEYDIVKVFTVKCEKLACIGDVFKDENLELIWERTETKRMTAEEIRQKLEELTGDKIEVEPTREEMIGMCYEFCSKQDCSRSCILHQFGNCCFKSYSDKKLKQCYEKVMEDGNN